MLNGDMYQWMKSHCVGQCSGHRWLEQLALWLSGNLKFTFTFLWWYHFNNSSKMKSFEVKPSAAVQRFLVFEDFFCAVVGRREFHLPDFPQLNFTKLNISD